jgi:hypothetical protein
VLHIFDQPLIFIGISLMSRISINTPRSFVVCWCLHVKYAHGSTCVGEKRQAIIS